LLRACARGRAGATQSGTARTNPLPSWSYDALQSGGALIVYEKLIDDARRENAQALLESLNMLVISAGGFNFSGTDCIGWMRNAGFRNMRLEPLAAGHSMVTGLK
jgi:hypothetical protein